MGNTQADDKIIRDRVVGEVPANQTHYKVGRKVRKAIKDIGGTMPESLKTEKSLRRVGTRKQKLLK